MPTAAPFVRRLDAKFPIAILLLTVLLTSGCGSLSIRQTRYDNPRVRALQARSLEEVEATPIAGESIDRFFRQRVALIESTNQVLASGRATPVSPDGYYLTAQHVVDQSPFYLSTFRFKKPIPPGVTVFESNDHFEIVRLPGRLIWSHPEVDVALVHFPHRPETHFAQIQSHPLIGESVFCAADRGKVFIDKKGRRFGNGPYQTAGTLLRREKADPEGEWALYETTLVGRGGMSGGPVVDNRGRLLGVASTVQLYWHWDRRKRTRLSFAALDPELMERIIQSDRATRSQHPFP